MNLAHVETPIGRLTLVAGETGLRRVLFARDPQPDGVGEGPDPVLTLATQQLEEYFAGERRTFELPLELVGTPFQLEVWRALASIPYGSTVTYGEQAWRLGRPAAARAVGHANGRNPLAIVLPCHRVVGASGALTGYGGGIEVKEALLELEARVVAGDRSASVIRTR